MVNLDGQLISSKVPLFSEANRAFRYGDSLFESIRMFDKKMPFLSLHIGRLLKGMNVLKINIPSQYAVKYFEGQINKVVEYLGYKNSRIRLTVFRAGGGLYTPQINEPSFLIEIEKLDDRNFIWNAEGLRVGLFDDWKVAPSRFTFFKSGNALPFVMANVFKKENYWDDVLVLNSNGNIVCGGSSNIFILKNDELITPPISEGCVEGTMRMKIIELASKMGVTIKEVPVSINDLKSAEELFLTNAIQGIRWVKEMNKVKLNYGFKTGKQMFSALNNFIAKT